MISGVARGTLGWAAAGILAEMRGGLVKGNGLLVRDRQDSGGGFRKAHAACLNFRVEESGANSQRFLEVVASNGVGEVSFRTLGREPRAIGTGASFDDCQCESHAEEQDPRGWLGVQALGAIVWLYPRQWLVGGIPLANVAVPGVWYVILWHPNLQDGEACKTTLSMQLSPCSFRERK